MARPEKNTVDYFSHDCDASDISKKRITIMKGKFGLAGPGFWWELLQRLGKSDGHYLDVRREIDLEFLLQGIGTDVVSGTEMLDKLAFLEAIDPVLWDHLIIWSQNFVDRLKGVYDKRRRPLPEKPCFCNENCQHRGISVTKTKLTTPETPQSKVNNSKVNNTTGNNNSSCSSNDFSSEIIDEIPNKTQEIFDLYENGIGLLTPLMEEDIRAALEKFPPEKIEFAIKEAVRKNHRSWSYIAGVLKNQGSSKPKPQNKSSPPDDPSKYNKPDDYYGRHVQH
jgi:DnaD/phage-associated family protein